ncbi:FAD-dependent oxidoreductase [Streptomyces noursei]|uniref:FAD-dependent oxidoreductase n=1 Tax=Streptomyces noursei TaxID=1971 RepID=UPI0007C85828|nr:tryptophan 7-halogenase [Streptomyces noursei]
MPAIVVGGSVAGLATALALSGAGYEVRVLERSAAPPEGPVEQAVRDWHRPTVPQAVHSHSLTSIGVRTLRRRAPRLFDALLAAGAEPLDLMEALPPLVEDRAREVGDDDLVALACRRTVLELLLYRFVRDLPQVRLEHGTVVRGLALDSAGERVRGVHTADGEVLPASVVIDATGRRAASRDWLVSAGVPVAEDLVGPSALTGYSRQYRLRGSGRPGPLNRGNAVAGVWDHYAAALHPADNRTFAVAVMVPTGDRATARLREPGAFAAAARATPGIGAWLAPGVSDPLTPVNVITCPPNTLRGTVTTRQRPVAGLFAVGDAACVTNPLYGRGLSLALDHAFRLADLLTDAVPDLALGQAAGRLAEQCYAPWYAFAASEDAQRAAQWQAATGVGRPPAQPQPQPQPQPQHGNGPSPARVRAASLTDGLVWRSVVRVVMGLSTPAAAFGDEKFRARVEQAPPIDPALLPAAPDRDAFLHLIAAAEGA